MMKDGVNKSQQAKNIMMSDQSTGNFNSYYEDHITSIVRRAEQEGQFESVKGQKLTFDMDLSYNPERLVNKVMKENGVVPRWMELGKEIDKLKKELSMYKDEYNIKRTITTINKKVMDYNLSAPRTVQKAGISLESYLRKNS